jgi:hypothetical protein
MMATDVYNVWDCVYGIMCMPCPHRAWCHDGLDESDANDEQMVDCMCKDQIVRIDHQIVQREEIENPLGAEIEDEDEPCEKDVTGDR